jgi:hypothetical protein
VEWVVREGVGSGGEINQGLYAHMNNKRKMKKKIIKDFVLRQKHKNSSQYLAGNFPGDLQGVSLPEQSDQSHSLSLVIAYSLSLVYP